MRISLLNPNATDWERLRAGVASACEGAPVSEKHSFESIKTLIDTGVCHWFACHDEGVVIADFITQGTTEDGQKVFNLPIMFGREMDRWQWVADDFFTAMAKHNGCKRIRVLSFKQGIGRFYDKLPLFQGWRR